MHVIRETLGEFAEVRRIGHQSTQIHIIAVGINDRKTVFSCQLDEQGTKRQKAAALVNDGSIYLLLRQIDEAAADLCFAHVGEEIHNQRDTKMLRCFAKRQSRAVVPGPDCKEATLLANGIASFRICRRLPRISFPALLLTPVRLPPGCARFVTNFSAIGSPVIATIGTVVVAAANA